MAKQLVTDIVINLAGNLAAKSRQYGQSMNQFAASNQRAMNMVKMFTARGAASTPGQSLRRIGYHHGGRCCRSWLCPARPQDLSRIAIAADISREKAKELKDEINAVSNTKEKKNLVPFLLFSL